MIIHTEQLIISKKVPDKLLFRMLSGKI